MTPRRSLIGMLAMTPFFANPWSRRALFLAVMLVCAVLTLFPQHYRAALSLTPMDPSSLALGGSDPSNSGLSIMGMSGGLSSVFGNQSTVEVSMKVARSAFVREKVAKRLGLDKRLGLTPLETARWLDRKVDIQSMRGGIVQIETKLSDAELGRDIVAAYGIAVREQLAVIGRDQIAYKREILLGLINESSERLRRAQAAYDNFRLRTRYSQPQAAIAAIGERIPELEATIKARQVELNATRQFATENNMAVRQLVAQIAALNQQLAQAKTTTPTQPDSVGRVVQESVEAEKLRRTLNIAQSMYEAYKKNMENVAVDDQTSPANVRILEPAYIDPVRQYNLMPLGLAILVGLLGLAIEFYGIRPPLGDRKTA